MISWDADTEDALIREQINAMWDSEESMWARLKYADYLDETGRPISAQYERLWVQLDGLPIGGDEYYELGQQLMDLKDAVNAESVNWRKSVGLAEQPVKGKPE